MPSIYNAAEIKFWEHKKEQVNSEEKKNSFLLSAE